MAIQVEVTGAGGFQGSKSALTDYSVQETATTLDPSQISGGVGTIQFGAVENEDSIFLEDNTIELTDGSRGIVTGSVRALSSSDRMLHVTADSKLILLTATKTAGPYVGTLGGAVSYYLSLVNISSDFAVDQTIASVPVTLGGWSDTVLSGLSDLCVAFQIEMSVVYDRIVFRPARSNVAVTTRESSESFSIERGNPAKTVEMFYYNYSVVTNGIVYPNTVETPRDNFQVNPGETLETTRVEMSASLTSVNQPNPTGYLAPNYSGSTSQYVVLGNDDLPIPAAEWSAKGGNVTVSIDPTDGHFLLIDITGMNEPNDTRAPYRVGSLSSGSSTYYNAFYITGSGVFFDKKKLVVHTGAVNTEVEAGFTSDNALVSTYAQALTAIQKTVDRYSGANYTITGSAVSINRLGAGSEFATSKLSVFNTEFLGLKLSVLDSEGWTFADFDDHYAALVTDQFENQVFGNASGSRIYRNQSWFRVDNATVTPQDVTYSAAQDTLWGDWDAVFAGDKLAVWDAAWSGHKLRDWGLKPLKVGA